MHTFIAGRIVVMLSAPVAGKTDTNRIKYSRESDDTNAGGVPDLFPGLIKQPEKDILKM